MFENPIENPIGTPGISPSSRPVGPDSDHPMSGSEQGEPKPFTLGPEGQKEGPAKIGDSDKPSPMEIIRDGSKKQQWSPEEMQEHMKALQANLQGANKALNNPDVTKKLTDTHYQALNALTNKMNPDMRAIAKGTGSEFNPPAKAAGDSALATVLKWVGSSQDSMNSAINSMGKMQASPNPANMLRVQFAMHRAQERSELFASIISAGVGTVKQIMSTQLG